MIKWINASNYWPMLNGGSIIVDGVADIGLKKEYEFQNHEVSIWVNFYCLLKHPMPHSENSDNDFSLDGAIFYKIDQYACCNAQECWDDHEEFRKSIGLDYYNIRKFSKTRKLTACLDLMSRWAYIDNDDEMKL